MNYELPDKYHAAIYVRRKFKDIVMEDEDDPTTSAQIKRIKEQMEEFPDVTIEHKSMFFSILVSFPFRFSHFLRYIVEGLFLPLLYLDNFIPIPQNTFCIEPR